MTGILRNLAIIAVIVVIGFAGWGVWSHLHKSRIVDSYKACVDAGNPVLETFPQVCVTKDGKRFTTPGAQSTQPPNEGAVPTTQ